MPVVSPLPPPRFVWLAAFKRLEECSLDLHTEGAGGAGAAHADALGGAGDGIFRWLREMSPAAPRARLRGFALTPTSPSLRLPRLPAGRARGGPAPSPYESALDVSLISALEAHARLGGAASPTGGRPADSGGLRAEPTAGAAAELLVRFPRDGSAVGRRLRTEAPLPRPLESAPYEDLCPTPGCPRTGARDRRALCDWLHGRPPRPRRAGAIPPAAAVEA